MTLIADGLLIAGALAAAFYCWILSARVKSLKDLDNGLGAAIAALSGKVDDMQSALRVTQKVTGESRSGIEDITQRAEKAAEDLSDLLDRVELNERRSSQRTSQKVEPEPEEEAEPADKRTVHEPAPTEALLQLARTSVTPREVPQSGSAAHDAENQARQSADVVQPLEPRRAPALSNAEKLQQEIRNRLALRDKPNEGGSDDVVKTIQSLLVAARK